MCSHTLSNSRNNPRNYKIPTGEDNFPPAQLGGFANDFLNGISQNLQIKEKLLFSTAQKPFSLLKFSWLKPRTFISASLCLLPSCSLPRSPCAPGREMWQGKFRDPFSDETWIQAWSKSTFDLTLLLTHFNTSKFFLQGLYKVMEKKGNNWNKNLWRYLWTVMSQKV